MKAILAFIAFTSIPVMIYKNRQHRALHDFQNLKVVSLSSATMELAAFLAFAVTHVYLIRSLETRLNQSEQFLKSLFQSPQVLSRLAGLKKVKRFNRVLFCVQALVPGFQEVRYIVVATIMSCASCSASSLRSLFAAQHILQNLEFMMMLFSSMVFALAHAKYLSAYSVCSKRAPWYCCDSDLAVSNVRLLGEVLKESDTFT